MHGIIIPSVGFLVLCFAVCVLMQLWEAVTAPPQAPLLPSQRLPQETPEEIEAGNAALREWVAREIAKMQEEAKHEQA